jgi:ubiquinone/menaquinone biosynthesis C-methylase UbiE
METEIEKKVIVDLACGQRKVTPQQLGINEECNVIGVDIAGDCDIKHDLFNNFPYPFEDGSVDYVYSSHFIEHIPMEYINGKDKLFAFIDEVYRILKPGGKVTLIFPNCLSTRAFQDPTHRRFIPAATVLYFNKAWRDINKLDHYNVVCDFDYVVGEAVNGNWVSRSQEAKQFAANNYWNVIDDLHFILTKR